MPASSPQEAQQSLPSLDEDISTIRHAIRTEELVIPTMEEVDQEFAISVQQDVEFSDEALALLQTFGDLSEEEDAEAEGSDQEEIADVYEIDEAPKQASTPPRVDRPSLPKTPSQQQHSMLRLEDLQTTAARRNHRDLPSYIPTPKRVVSGGSTSTITPQTHRPKQSTLHSSASSWPVSKLGDSTLSRTSDRTIRQEEASSTPTHMNELARCSQPLPPPSHPFSISPWKTPLHASTSTTTHRANRPRQSFLLSPTPLKRHPLSASTSSQFNTSTPNMMMNFAGDQSLLKDILPPFQSPWRKRQFGNNGNRDSMAYSEWPGSVRRSVSPRKSGLFGTPTQGGNFRRTPLKSGKRLSAIVPPLGSRGEEIVRNGGFGMSLNATLRGGMPNGSPRVSLDEESEEASHEAFYDALGTDSRHVQVVHSLLRDSTSMTPPDKSFLTPGRRIPIPSPRKGREHAWQNHTESRNRGSPSSSRMSFVEEIDEDGAAMSENEQDDEAAWHGACHSNYLISLGAATTGIEMFRQR